MSLTGAAVIALSPLPRCDTRIESAVRYLGIEVDDALSIAERVDL
jgi:hypothetical protein